MKLSLKKTFSALGIFAALSFSGAQANDIRLGQPGYGGNGCPGGTASATLSPDRKSLSILFDEFMVEAGGSTRRSVQRKSCNIAVPVHVPSGISVSIIKVDYRGYLSLPRSASARFSAEYFFAGRRGPRYQKNWRGYTDREYAINNRIGVGAVVWSPCGADVNLRVNASMLVKNRDRRNEALATVDSADFNAGLVYRLAFRRCR